ncbi:MAG: HEAT repeat domain-containing protein [Cyanobacteria bacterium J007]|jgi:HEAT repeat protein|nr:MAG: HEAT repeat domain-containing protein [Cyanobacteria bacterium J007]
MSPSSADLLARANAASAGGNWSQVLDCLQQLLARDDEAPGDRHGGTTAAIALQLTLDSLANGDFRQRWEATKLLPYFGEAAIAPLLVWIGDRAVDGELRWFAVRAATDLLRHPVSSQTRTTTIAALANLLAAEEDDDLRDAATSALAELGEGAIDILAELMQEPQSRRLAVRAIAQIQHPRVVEPLLAAIADPDVEVRAIAWEAAIALDDPRLPSLLLKALDDPSARVRRQGAIGLGLWAARGSLDDRIRVSDLVRRLRDRLWDLNLEVCQQAAIALGRLDSPAAAAALSELFAAETTPMPLKLAAVRALGWMSVPEAVDALQDAIQLCCRGGNEGEKLPAAFAAEIAAVLGRQSESPLRERAAEVLVALLDADPRTRPESAEVKKAIVLGLGELGDSRAIEPSIRLLADPDASVRLHAIAALKRLDPERTYQRLQERAADPTIAPDLREGIAIALQEWHR